MNLLYVPVGFWKPYVMSRRKSNYYKFIFIIDFLKKTIDFEFVINFGTNIRSSQVRSGCAQVSFCSNITKLQKQ